jgi:hypothetical protein
MALNSSPITELAHEASGTRKIFECRPDEKPVWMPHEKSMTSGRLSTHMADTPEWFSRILNGNEFNFETSGYKTGMYGPIADDSI